MYDLGAIAAGIAKLSSPILKNKMERNEKVIQLLKKFKLSPTHPPSDFDGVYAYTLVEYGVDKSDIILNFFRDQHIKDIFKKSFSDNDSPYFHKESEEILDWHEMGKKYRDMDIDPRRELIAFSTVFNAIVARTLTPKEVQNVLVLKNIHLTVDEILEKVSKLDTDKILEEINSIQTNNTKFSLTTTSEKIRVYIGSSPTEFRDTSDILAKALKDRGIDVLICNRHAFSSPTSKEKTIKREIETSDIYIGLFGKLFSLDNMEEFKLARTLNKPCFVYVRDEHAVRDPELEMFLKKEVYNFSKGVTNSFFENSILLGNQVAEDVMKWLVRQHREMTAEIRQENLSKEEISRLEEKVRRLQKSAHETLPFGTRLDYLSNQLRTWFDAVGYRIEKYEKSNEDYFEWIINIPARRGYDRILVRGITGEIEFSHIKDIKESIMAVDEGWIITSRRVSQVARDRVKEPEYRKILCYTFDELIDEHADFSGYLEWLNNEIKGKGIDQNYIPLACIKEEFDSRSKEKIGESRYDETNGWIEGYIDRWLDDPDKKHMSILGEFGTGKTWFSLHYAGEALKQYQDAKEKGTERPRIPLVISLRDYAKAVSVESLFSEFFFRKHQIPLPHYEAFEVLNKMGKLLLIFDGFDEMAAQVDRQKMINNFWELAKAAVPGSKVILTCRTEHFPHAMEGRSLLNAELHASTSTLTGEPPQFEVLQLEKFNKEQIRQVLNQKTDKDTVEKIINNSELLDLVSRPVMTDFVMDAIPDIELGRAIDLSRVYFYAVVRKMNRDIREERTFTSLADKLYFLCELSWEMISTDQMSLNYRHFPDRLRVLFGKFVQEQKDLDHWHYDMMGQTLLIRNSDGDYTPAHKSLLEFFVAYKFVAELGLLGNDYLSPAKEAMNLDTENTPKHYTWSEYYTNSYNIREDKREGKVIQLLDFKTESFDNLLKGFGSKILTQAVLDLMLNMICKEKALDVLLSLILYTRDKQKEKYGFLGSNAAMLLVMIDKNALSNLNLSGVDISESSINFANLTNSIFDHANLEGVVVNNANFKNASLKYCKFTNAKIDNFNGWITASPYIKDNLLINYFYFYYNFLSKRDKPPTLIDIENDHIVIGYGNKDKLIWANKIRSDFIVSLKINNNKLHILTIEGDLFVLDIETGEFCKDTSDTNLYLWENADFLGAEGLDDEMCHFLAIKKAVNLPQFSYDTRSKRVPEYFKDSIEV
ncbi:putative NACHT family NTPase [Metabacillus crassostreae]|uniref:NACHT domain-containing protein n=1 Tax=Metabacillus crassostreae TaxID=929098 RepID=UPI00195759EF|nr:NACHT domain-containing protein [Metabacillus crassostreae]MBM7605585.1 putative NACHT family NTPase [Metabacillus crassostreae]